MCFGPKDVIETEAAVSQASNPDLGGFKRDFVNNDFHCQQWQQLVFQANKLGTDKQLFAISLVDLEPLELNPGEDADADIAELNFPLQALFSNRKNRFLDTFRGNHDFGKYNQHDHQDNDNTRNDGSDLCKLVHDSPLGKTFKLTCIYSIT